MTARQPSLARLETPDGPVRLEDVEPSSGGEVPDAEMVCQLRLPQDPAGRMRSLEDRLRTAVRDPDLGRRTCVIL